MAPRGCINNMYMADLLRSLMVRAGLLAGRRWARKQVCESRGVEGGWRGKASASRGEARGRNDAMKCELDFHHFIWGQSDCGY